MVPITDCGGYLWLNRRDTMPRIKVYDKHQHVEDRPDWRVVGICWPAVWSTVKYWLWNALVFGLFMLWGFSRV